jgi:hypothetical protein
MNRLKGCHEQPFAFYRAWQQKANYAKTLASAQLCENTFENGAHYRHIAPSDKHLFRMLHQIPEASVHRSVEKINTWRQMRIVPFMACLLMLLCSLPAVAEDTAKQRIVILTDIGADPGDQQSLVRLLLYSNELNIEGLLATSRMEQGLDTRPELIESTIAAYGKVYANLQQHRPGYPSPDSLLNRVKTGLGDPSKMGEGWNTQASRWLTQCVERRDERPLWICIWGGSRELAQALWSVRDRRDKKAMTAFIEKIRIYAVGDQDRWGYWINKNFPELFYIYAGSCGDRACSGYRGQYLTGDQSMQDGAWIEANIRQTHGALGAQYPRNGASTNGMKEGDTPSFMYCYRNGLMEPDHPQWGGWGGRFQQDREGYYIDAADQWQGSQDERYSVSRWRPAFQRDLQARMDWCRTANQDSANHHPVVIVNGQAGRDPVLLQAQTGQTIELDSNGTSDPDQQPLNYLYWAYQEPSNITGYLKVQDGDQPRCRLTIPYGLSGKSIHIILQVTDTGDPPLTSYRRIIINIE